MTNPLELKVGFIGFGDQGAPMARAIAEAGFELHVWARRIQSLDALAGVPYIAHDTPAELGAVADIVGLCLNVDDNIRDVMTSGGLLAAMKPGAVLVNHGTGLPSFAVEMTRLAGEHCVEVLDAPVSGGHAGAVAKRLATIVGGEPEVVDKCRPVFESFAAKIAVMGGAGTGQMAKLINNALLMTNQDNLHDMLAIADGMHVDISALVDLLRAGTGSSRALDFLGSAITSDNAPHLRDMQLVDMEIFADAVRDLGKTADAFTTRAVHGAEILPDLADRIH
jgi:3-hydroxyisobutyrate dehydrogenase-like beta-hydroxyacid dehydrogenase